MVGMYSFVWEAFAEFTPSIPYLQNVTECVVMGVAPKQMQNFIKHHVMKTHVTVMHSSIHS